VSAERDISGNRLPQEKTVLITPAKVVLDSAASDRSSPVRGGLRIARQALPGKRKQAVRVPAGTAAQSSALPNTQTKNFFSRALRDCWCFAKRTRQFLPGYSQSRLTALPNSISGRRLYPAAFAYNKNPSTALQESL